MRSSGITRASLLAAAAIAGLGAAVVTPAPDGAQARADAQAKADQKGQKPSTAEQRAAERAVFSRYYRPWFIRYPQGPGWTIAQVKRMARKKRNQARNRRAHRG